MLEDPWAEDVTETILGQTTALLAQRGDEQAVSLLIDVQSMGYAGTGEDARRAWDEWLGWITIMYRAAVLDVEDHLVPRFTQDVCERIADTLSYVADRNGESDIKYVWVQPALPKVDDNWRETYAARLAVERPTNQARRERGVTQHPTEDGLTFGSDEELRVYRALRRIQARQPEDDTFAIMPLPGSRLRAGHTWSPDVVVAGRGRAVVIEVDGPHHRAVVRRADDGNRDLQWRRCGIPVVRLTVEDVADDSALDHRLREELKRHLPRAS